MTDRDFFTRDSGFWLGIAFTALTVVAMAWRHHDRPWRLALPEATSERVPLGLVGLRAASG